MKAAGPVDGAVHRYQTEFETSPGSDASSDAPSFVPPTDPSSPLMTTASAKSSFGGASRSWRLKSPVSPSTPSMAIRYVSASSAVNVIELPNVQASSLLATLVKAFTALPV